VNIFGNKDTTASLSADELIRELETALHSLSIVLAKVKTLEPPSSLNPRLTPDNKTFSFTHIWMLATTFGVITVIPLVLFVDRYPWAVFTTTCVGVVYILALDLLKRVRDERRVTTLLKNQSGPVVPMDLSHRKTIDTAMHYEVDFWSAHFDITQEELREAVKFVGSRVEDVRNYLEYKKKKTTPPCSADPPA